MVKQHRYVKRNPPYDQVPRSARGFLTSWSSRKTNYSLVCVCDIITLQAI